MKNTQAILFDFDGVILESVDVKGWAFGKLFEQYPEHVDTIVEYHHANGGVPRFDKIRYIYKEILKEPLTEEKYQQLCDEFSSLVFDKVVASDYVPGAKEFIVKYYQQVPMFIVSGTPQGEMDQVVDATNLRQYFKGVFGSPRNKGEWTKEILEQNKFSARQVVFIGDAMSDYEAAKEHGLVFIGRVPKGKPDIFADLDADCKVCDLVDLEGIIHEVV